MSWEEREILLIAKTYPTKSKQYVNTVCTAGILEDTEEFIRIYPIRWTMYFNSELHNFVRFKALVKKTNEKLMRKESHKIKENTIKVIDNSLVKTNKNVWEQRNKIIRKYLSKSVHSLNKAFKEDKTSLGIIKPKIESVEFKLKKSIDNIKIEEETTIQYDLFNRKIPKADDIEKAFSYKFKCAYPKCNGHDTICEDWQLLETFRSWKKIYSNLKEFEKKFINRYQNFMISRDLHFIMGTDFQFGKFMIIGLYYPPINLKLATPIGQTRLTSFIPDVK